MMRLKTIVVYILVLWYGSIANAQQKIVISNFGLDPNTHENSILYVKKALEACKTHPNSILYFPKGRYDFYPIDTPNITNIVDEKASVTIGFDLKNLKNIIIDGGGSEFIFHGKMQIVKIDSCSGITLKNFSADWDRPLLSQAEIIDVGDNYLDMKIDKKLYPYMIENSRIYFLGENWILSGSNMFITLYDEKNKEILYNTWDGTIGDVLSQKVEEKSDGILRFFMTPKIKPEAGTIALLAVNARRYLPFGIESLNSKNILLKDLRVYHALCCAIVFTRCENVTLDNASVKVNEAKGRVFSSVADACGFGNCRGLVKVENCAHTGQGDDFMNISGAFVGIKKRINDYTFEVSERGDYLGSGDEIWFLDPKTFQRGKTAFLKSVAPITKEKKGYIVTFAKEVPKEIQPGVYIENKTWNASLEFRHNDIGRKNRARGILIQTPERALVENNYFHTAGTAILFEGDISVWFGGSANRNVVIRNNLFDNCLTSGNKHGDRWEWGDAVISIMPFIEPESAEDIPYHRNIHIENNIFKVFDAPLVRGIAAEGVYFKNNSVIKTYDFKPYTWQKSAFLFDGCRDITISGNKIDPNYTTRSVLIDHMKKTEVMIDKNQDFTLDFVKTSN